MKPAPDRSAEYQVVAPVYDRLIAPLLASEYHKAQILTEHIKAKTVVDLCCGTGVLAKQLATGGFTVTGVDLSVDMLKQARGKHHPNLTFLHANAARTGLPADRFDLAIISMALHEKPADLREQIMLEAKRLITPSGHILLIDYSRPTSLTGRFARMVAEAIERLAGREHHAHYRTFIAAGGLEGLIDRANMVVRACHSFHMGLIKVCLTSTTHP
ncbi:class I SAM-dependent methyltransferase [Desulfoplanes formicivorans]|uniref:Type 11 methyltransferase n=1 Tax=Desulfoplanes formicivorans TaxID=1592317 RepID=A0A194AFS1_9BACT|nr:class I SAM-dependent methyltransferase [Desulfoplanes formicivorans]GAU08178.1 type 11 methyltransferase [Desulfoplanes formicivorans]